QTKSEQNRNPQTTGQGQRDQSDSQHPQPQSGQNRNQQQTDQGQREERQDRQQGGRQDDTSRQGGVDVSVEQRTRIRETVLSRRDVPRADNVNFNVSIGAVVPTRVRFAPVPREIVEIRPEFRGHQYFVVRDEIVIIDNRRHVVAVISSEG